jgi:hypothetical protein
MLKVMSSAAKPLPGAEFAADARRARDTKRSSPLARPPSAQSSATTHSSVADPSAAAGTPASLMLCLGLLLVHPRQLWM